MTQEELRVLHAALRSPQLECPAMGVDTLHGFATALVIGPRLLVPSQWLAWVWDRDDGRAEPVFESMALAAALTGEVMRLYNEVATAFADDPEAFVPLYAKGDGEWSPFEWSRGFMRGVTLAYKDWSPLIVGAPLVFEPLQLLGTDGGIVGLTDERIDALIDAVLPSVVALAAHWRAAVSFAPGGPTPIRRDAPKLGRNDPCHCGSGLKYKKCHGAN